MQSLQRCIRPLESQKFRLFLLVFGLLLMSQHAAYAGFQERLKINQPTQPIRLKMDEQCWGQGLRQSSDQSVT